MRYKIICGEEEGFAFLTVLLVGATELQVAGLRGQIEATLDNERPDIDEEQRTRPLQSAQASQFNEPMDDYLEEEIGFKKPRG